MVGTGRVDRPAFLTEAMRCFMAKRPKPLAMRAARARTSGLTPGRKYAGTSRCAPAKRRTLGKSRESNRLINELERLKASIWAKDGLTHTRLELG